MTRARLLPLPLAVVVSVAVFDSAHADDKPPCSDEAAAVKRMSKRDPSLAYPKAARAVAHLEAGKRAFGVQKYDKAAEEYTSAGLDDEAPLILYNLGQTYRAAKNYEKAIRQYELFLERGKPGPQVRALVACHITTMKAELAHAASTAPLTEPASDQVAPPTTRRVGAAPATISSDARARPAGSAPETSVATTASSRWTTTRRIALGLGATGVISLAAGVVFGTQSQGSKGDAAQLCPKSPCADADQANALAERADQRATLANVSYGVGAAMVAGAAILWYVGAPSVAAPTPNADSAIMPHLTSTFAGVAYQRSF